MIPQFPDFPIPRFPIPCFKDSQTLIELESDVNMGLKRRSNK